MGIDDHFKSTAYYIVFQFFFLQDLPGGDRRNSKKTKEETDRGAIGFNYEKSGFEIRQKWSWLFLILFSVFVFFLMPHV